MATTDALRDALATVDHPVLGEDIVSLNLVRDIEIDGTTATVYLAMNAPFSPAERLLGEGVVAAGEDLGLEVEVSAGMSPTEGDGLPSVRNTIVVAAGKGGVGKTTIAVNLAAALAERGARVGLLDADVHGPNVTRLLPVTTDATLTDEGSIVPPSARGVSVMSMGLLLRDQDDPVILRGPMVNDVRARFVEEVEWGPLDYLVIDLPPGTGDGSLDILQTVNVTGVILVTTPHPMARDDVRKTIGLFERHNLPFLGAVENMATTVCPGCDEEHAPLGDGGLDDLIDDSSIHSIGSLPIDGEIGRATTPIVWQPQHPYAPRIREMTVMVLDRVSVINTRLLTCAPTDDAVHPL